MKAWWVVAIVVGSCSSSPAPVAKPAPPAESPTPPPAPVAVPQPPAFRLPGDVKPISYALELTIIPAQPKMSGIVRIVAQVERATDVVWLNAEGLHVTSATIDGHPVDVIPGGEHHVGLHAAVKPGPIGIEVSYDGPIDHERSRGIYAVKEGDLDYAYTFFEPIDARRAFPCFDEPNFKVPWQLTFHVQEDHMARSNARVIKETAEPNHMKRVEMAVTKPIPSYLVAFMVGPFDDVDDGVAGRAHTPIHFIVPKGRRDELGYAKQITPKVVEALETYMDMDYPFVKLDVAVVPRYWGTMEHPGIVAMGQPLTLIRPDQKNLQREQRYEDILAHELGHYWFGDVVTLAWWNGTWLNEALGEWFDAVITDMVMPSWKWKQALTGQTTYAMQSDETVASRAMNQPVTTNEGIQASFDNSTTYYKGSAVLRQLEHFVGPEKWQHFIRTYIHAHEYANATPDDFIATMKQVLGDDAAASMTSYVNNPGVPLVHAHAECAQKQIVIDPLKRAMPTGVTVPAVTYTAPVCVRYGDAKHADHACTMGPPIAVAYCPTWIVPNDGGLSYYRSHITTKQAANLLDQSSPAKLDRSEKTMVIADLAAAVTRDELAIDEALGLVQLILKDPDPGVESWASRVAPLHPGGMSDPMFEKSRAWFVKGYLPIAGRLGWAIGKDDSDDTIRLRQVALSRVAPFYPSLLAQARKLVAQWLKDRTGLADPMVNTALGAVAYTGSASDFDAYQAVLDKPHDRQEALRMFVALGKFVDPILAKRARTLVFDPKYDLRESIVILDTQLDTRETQEAALVAIEEHIDELIARQRSDEAAGFLGEIASAFCDAAHRDRVSKLLADRAKKIDGAQISVARGLELTDQCIAQVAHDAPALQRFFGK
ncbi:MAG: M1 family metallopeptidase [Kofleriaceae bacterium]